MSKVGRTLYEKFFRNYTRKQWGLDPSELDRSVIARISTRTNRDDRYFTDTYQAMPLYGFTQMCERRFISRLRQINAEGAEILARSCVQRNLSLVSFSSDLVFDGNLIDGECGLWHLANPGAIGWADLAQLVARLAGLDATKVEAHSSATLGLVAPRPTYSVLSSKRGTLLPVLDHAIDRYLQERHL